MQHSAVIIMKKILFLFIILLPLPLAGQMFRSTNQQLIEDAIRSGLVLYTHSYQLQDTTTLQKYGRNGQEDFGKSFSVGIKVKNGFIFNDIAMTPWLFDSNFERYRNEYRPISHKARMRVIRDSTFCDCQVFKEVIDSYHNTPFNRVKYTEPTECIGFDLDTIPGTKTGWLVWVLSDDAIDSPDSLHSETYMIYRKELSFQADTVKQSIEAPQTDKHIWGGIYVTPKQTDIGQIKFFLTGMAYHEKDESWSLYSPFLKEEEEQLPENQDVLTPVDPDNPPAPSEQGGKKSKKGKTRK